MAERLKPEGVYQQFVAYRESLGMEIIPTVGRRAAAAGRARGPAARRRMCVPLLADRDLSARGVEVEFFGGRTRMPAGPALLALRTGAPLYVVSLWYDGDRPRGRLDGPIPVPPPESGALDARVQALTQQIADALAAGIAEHPADWHMLQKLWLADRRRPPAPVRPDRRARRRVDGSG